MSGTALFLGAGASRPFGFPVTAEILPELLRRLGEGRLFRESGGLTAGERERRTVETRELLGRFLPGLFRGAGRPPLVTDLLSLLDQLLATSNAVDPGLDPSALARLRILLELGIAEVLAEPEPRDEGHDTGGLMERFVDWILRTAEGGRRVTIVSTNYDFALERRLLGRFDPGRIAETVDFGFTWRPADGSDHESHPRPRAPLLAVHKLHGSLNWLRCPLCDHIYIHPTRPIFRLGQQPDGERTNDCTCGYGPLRHMIVTPSMVRDMRDPNLLTLWQSALEALRTAEDWTIIGYSLPAEDIAIQSLLLRAWRGRARPPRLRVVQRGDAREIEERYRLLFPELVFDRGGVETFVASLSG